MVSSSDSTDAGSTGSEDVPEPPAGYTEGSPTQTGGGSSGPPTNPTLAEEERQIAAEMQEESGQLSSEIDHRRSIEERWVPGSTTLDHAWKGHEAKLDAELPAEEAQSASKGAGEVATDADEDRHEIEQDAARIGTADEIVQRDKAEAEQLANDAIDAGLRTTQDALDAKLAYKTKDPVSARAAEAAAQRDLGRASHDLAEEDALLKEVEGEAQQEPGG
jgi:hypothetical protein